MIKQRVLFIRKIAALTLLSLSLSGLLAGCADKWKEADDTSDQVISGSNTSDNSKTVEGIQSETEKETAFPGSYTVPEDWVEVDKYSTEKKIFYVEEGHEEDEFPDNISIEIGNNQYSAEEHEEFRVAILRQLAMQIQDTGAELTGDGTNTEQDYIVYIFTISEGDMVTKQYYIVGDKRYCLVHLTNFTGSESADEAAQAIVDSFVWD